MQFTFFIILALFFIIVCVLFFIIVFLRRKIDILINEKISLIEKNEELLDNNQFLKDKVDFLDLKFQNIYDNIKENETEFSEFNKNQIFDSNNSFILNLYSDFILKLKDEIERKKRYSFFSFTVLRISVDFFSEYSASYGNLVNDFIQDLKTNIPDVIRKIDYFAESKNKEVVFALIPMTELDGASILAKRIQELAENLSKEKVITLTISVCQPEKCYDISQIMKTLIDLSAEGEASGGNTIKVKKI